VTHGEPDSADALRLRISRELGWDVSVPLLGQRVEIEGL
jgi:metallo-beta-lactamase family protein